MLKASPAPGGTKAACLLINSKNITAQMLIFFPCHFPLQNAPVPNCSAALLPLGAEAGQHGWHQARLASPRGGQTPTPGHRRQEPERRIAMGRERMALPPRRARKR